MANCWGAAVLRLSFLIHNLAVADAPDVGRADVAAAIAGLDPAPAVAALADASDDARLRQRADPCAIVWADADRPRVAGLHDRRPAVAEEGHQHPALRSVGVLDHPPVLIFLDHAHRQVAALVQPDVRIIAAGAGVGHRLPRGDRGPVGRLLLFLRE